MTHKQALIQKTLLVLLSLAFLFAGGMKLLGNPMEVGMFAHWGYPLWFMYFTGACEVLGAIGLHIPKVSR